MEIVVEGVRPFVRVDGCPATDSAQLVESHGQVGKFLRFVSMCSKGNPPNGVLEVACPILTIQSGRGVVTRLIPLLERTFHISVWGTLLGALSSEGRLILVSPISMYYSCTEHTWPTPSSGLPLVLPYDSCSLILSSGNCR